MFNDYGMSKLAKDRVGDLLAEKRRIAAVGNERRAGAWTFLLRGKRDEQRAVGDSRPGNRSTPGRDSLPCSQATVATGGC